MSQSTIGSLVHVESGKLKPALAWNTLGSNPVIVTAILTGLNLPSDSRAFTSMQWGSSDLMYQVDFDIDEGPVVVLVPCSCINIFVGTQSREIEPFDVGAMLNFGAHPKQSSLICSRYLKQQKDWNTKSETYEVTIPNFATKLLGVNRSDDVDEKFEIDFIDPSGTVLYRTSRFKSGDLTHEMPLSNDMSGLLIKASKPSQGIKVQFGLDLKRG